MKIVCITGGIGSGKSLVSKIIETLGYPVYCSDERAKQMYFHPEIKLKVIDLLGTEAYINDYQINKKHIADKIFSDKHLLNQINEIIHNAVKDDFKNFLQKHQNSSLIFKESALIFEAQLQKNCDKIILVTAPTELRIQRVMKRDNISKEEVLNRMKHQLDDSIKISQSDYVIQNDEQHSLLVQVFRILDDLKSQ